LIICYYVEAVRDTIGQTVGQILLQCWKKELF